jgi:hypothetical protein
VFQALVVGGTAIYRLVARPPGNATLIRTSPGLFWVGERVPGQVLLARSLHVVHRLEIEWDLLVAGDFVEVLTLVAVEQLEVARDLQALVRRLGQATAHAAAISSRARTVLVFKNSTLVDGLGEDLRAKIKSRQEVNGLVGVLIER